MQEHDELEDVIHGQQPQKAKDKAGLLSKALRAPLGTRTLSLHNLLDQAPFLEGQQVSWGCTCKYHLCMPVISIPVCGDAKLGGHAAVHVSCQPLSKCR